ADTHLLGERLHVERLRVGLALLDGEMLQVGVAHPVAMPSRQLGRVALGAHPGRYHMPRHPSLGETGLLVRLQSVLAVEEPVRPLLQDQGWELVASLERFGVSLDRGRVPLLAGVDLRIPDDLIDRQQLRCHRFLPVSRGGQSEARTRTRTTRKTWC